MQRKKVDSRVRAVLQNGIARNHRSFFVIVGDRGRDQVVNLHLFLTKARGAKKQPSVLWCYKKELGFTSNRKKRMKKIKREIQKGHRDEDKDDPFELFVSCSEIQYVYYSESNRILGNTFGMCVLQDFEAMTPNLLAKTIETVEGGGVIVLLLKSMDSLKQLHTMAMDVHARYRTEAHQDVVARFNERFLLSLANCEMCLVVDDELNVMPITAARTAEIEHIQFEQKQIEDSNILTKQTVTQDQQKALLKFMEAIADKNLNQIVCLTASRGRGKSASMGLSIAAAIKHGFSNIVVTSPAVENLKTLFEFVILGLVKLGYEEFLDFDVVRNSQNQSHKKTSSYVVRINVFKNHRQTITYIDPNMGLAHAELLVIDEVAAIPLPTVRKLMGSYLCFMASTVHGYEGTGRSLSLKLLEELRGQKRKLVEITMEMPIRYAPLDPVEKWMNQLLCLDAKVEKIIGCPDPMDCELYRVSRDVLFSFHPVAEEFLQRMMALYVSSHYKNSPNDLQLMSDAPAHDLFVFCRKQSVLPDPLVVIQVCYEGKLTKKHIRSSLQRGVKQSGDLIPWCLSEQFQDENFASLSGARIVRIATHPDYTGMGYGTRALELLQTFFESEQTTTSEQALLVSLKACSAPKLDWIGTSYGMTPNLLRFWTRLGFQPCYLRQTANEITGEHSCIMIKGNFDFFHQDFCNRFLRLLGLSFQTFSSVFCLTILQQKKKQEKIPELDQQDIKRLENYTRNLVDYHVILDLVPMLSRIHFDYNVVNLTNLQESLLLGIGLQNKSIQKMSSEFNLAHEQVMALFLKIMHKFVKVYNKFEERKITVPEPLPIINQEYEELSKEQKQMVKQIDISKFNVAQDWSEAEIKGQKAVVRNKL